jgi:hypothetical protein
MVLLFAIEDIKLSATRNSLQSTCDSVPLWTHQGHKLESVLIVESARGILKSPLITSNSHIFHGFTKRRFMAIY